MSSDLSEFEGYFLTNPFSPLSDSSSIDIFKPFQENNFNLNPLSPTLTHNILDIPFTEIDQITPTTTLLSSSPPSHHLESLSLHQMGNSVNSLDVCPIDVKAEENQLPFYDYYVNNNSLMSHSYEGCDNRLKMMQRSYSSKSFDGRPNGFVFQPKFDSLIESSNNDPHMRRVCSTGDLQVSLFITMFLFTKTIYYTHYLYFSPTRLESSTTKSETHIYIHDKPNAFCSFMCVFNFDSFNYGHVNIQLFH